MLDPAGWHTRSQLVVPPGIDLGFLPAYSLELHPAERVWPVVDAPVANRAFADLDALEAVLVARCRTLEADWARLQAHPRFHGWPEEPRPKMSQRSAVIGISDRELSLGQVAMRLRRASELPVLIRGSAAATRPPTPR